MFVHEDHRRSGPEEFDDQGDAIWSIFGLPSKVDVDDAFATWLGHRGHKRAVDEFPKPQKQRSHIV